MTKSIWDEKPLVGNHKYWSESQYEGDFNHTQFMIDRNAWLEKLKAEHDELKKKADRLDELLIIYKRHYGNVIEYALELQGKAEKWDDWGENYKQILIDKEQEINRLHRIIVERGQKLEAIRNWINRKPPCIKSSLKLGELERLLETS